MARKIDKLCISYDDLGAEIRQEMMITMIGDVFEASLSKLEEAQMPSGDDVIWVYPVFMQTGKTVTETLPARLKEFYEARGKNPEIVMKPVWGADFPLACFITPVLQNQWQEDSALLVVAHGVSGMAAPPEPMRFLNMVSIMAPEIEETAVAYFGAEPTAEQAIAALKSRKVVVLPFLIGEGKHFHEDMPTAELAAKYGKTLKVLPPAGKLYFEGQREQMSDLAFFTATGDYEEGPDWDNAEETLAWYRDGIASYKDNKEADEEQREEKTAGAGAVIEQIHRAFDGVRLEDGIGLMQGDYEDCGASAEVAAVLAEHDERQDWTLLTPEALNFCHAALSFTDAKGYRFLLPAFMCADLNNNLYNDLFLACTEDWAEHYMIRAHLLNEEQRRAVEAYEAFRQARDGEAPYPDRKLPWLWEG